MFGEFWLGVFVFCTSLALAPIEPSPSSDYGGLEPGKNGLCASLQPLGTTCLVWSLGVHVAES